MMTVKAAENYVTLDYKRRNHSLEERLVSTIKKQLLVSELRCHCEGHAVSSGVRNSSIVTRSQKYMNKITKSTDQAERVMINTKRRA